MFARFPRLSSPSPASTALSRQLFSPYSRRDFLGMGVASALGVSFSGWLPQLAKAAESSPGSKGKACILLWMSGGPSQMDTFDLKPGHANGGPYKEIQTAAPGVRISQHLPGVADQMKDLAIIRSLTTTEGEHGLATQLMLTGYQPRQAAVQYPSLGSLVSKELGRDDNDLPNFVSLSPMRLGDAGFLGPNYSPLTVSGQSGDPNTRANLALEDLAPPRAGWRHPYERIEFGVPSLDEGMRPREIDRLAAEHMDLCRAIVRDGVVRQVLVETEIRDAVQPATFVGVPVCRERGDRPGSLHDSRAKPIPVFDRHAETLHQGTCVFSKSLLPGNKRIAVMRVLHRPLIEVGGDTHVVMRADDQDGSLSSEPSANRVDFIG